MSKLDGTNIYGMLNVFGETKLKRDLQLFGDFYISGTKLTSTIDELNKLDGFTGTVDDLNYAKDLRATGVTTTEFDKLDGLTATTTELNAVDGVTTIGTSIIRLANPSAVTFLRMNADNTVSSLAAADFRTAIGAGTGSSNLALGETSVTAYRGDRGKSAYDHSVLVDTNPHNVSKSNVGLGSVENYGIASTVESEAGTSNVKYMTPLRTKEAILDKFDYNSSTGVLIIDVT